MIVMLESMFVLRDTDAPMWLQDKTFMYPRYYRGSRTEAFRFVSYKNTSGYHIVKI